MCDIGKGGVQYGYTGVANGNETKLSLSSVHGHFNERPYQVDTYLMYCPRP